MNVRQKCALAFTQSVEQTILAPTEPVLVLPCIALFQTILAVKCEGHGVSILGKVSSCGLLSVSFGVIWFDRSCPCPL